MSLFKPENMMNDVLPDVFTAVKHSVTARQAAEMYGVEVNSHGMACCPFHDDTHPSMKLDERYYCFGCHASGDAIDFVSNLFQIGKRDAALKIAEDFKIAYDPKKRPGRGRPITPEQRKEAVRQRLRRYAGSPAARRQTESQQPVADRRGSDAMKVGIPLGFQVSARGRNRGRFKSKI